MFLELLVEAAEDCRVQAELDLLAAHRAVLERHLDDDIETWLASETESVVVASGGEVFDAPAAQRSAYLGATEFDIYRDMVAPRIEIAADCSLAWVIAQVEARGTTVMPDGTFGPIAFQSAWIELYRQVGDAWLMTGNVSNFKSGMTPADIPDTRD